MAFTSKTPTGTQRVGGSSGADLEELAAVPVPYWWGVALFERTAGCGRWEPLGRGDQKRPRGTASWMEPMKPTDGVKVGNPSKTQKRRTRNTTYIFREVHSVPFTLGTLEIVLTSCVIQYHLKQMVGLKWFTWTLYVRLPPGQCIATSANLHPLTVV